jgi:hypothetical protein
MRESHRRAAQANDERCAARIMQCTIPCEAGAHIQVRFDPQTETVSMTDRIHRHWFSIFGSQSHLPTLPAWGKGMHIIDLG